MPTEPGVAHLGQVAVAVSGAWARRQQTQYKLKRVEGAHSPKLKAASAAFLANGRCARNSRLGLLKTPPAAMADQQKYAQISRPTAY
jgi:hypothetical protein